VEDRRRYQQAHLRDAMRGRVPAEISIAATSSASRRPTVAWLGGPLRGCSRNERRDAAAHFSGLLDASPHRRRHRRARSR